MTSSNLFAFANGISRKIEKKKKFLSVEEEEEEEERKKINKQRNIFTRDGILKGNYSYKHYRV